MSELVVKAGSWNSFTAAESEAFLATVSGALGFTQEQQDFLKRVHDDIHGRYKPDQFYSQTMSTIISWMPSMILREIYKDCDADHKKQVKIWYNELINLNSSKNSPLYEMLVPSMTQLVNQL